MQINYVRIGLSALVQAVGLTACTTRGSAPAASPTTTRASASQPTLIHDTMGHDALPQTNAPFDAQFIDGMTKHHQGPIAMAQQVLQESRRPELLQLANNIISSQQQEIAQLATWRKQWYPDLAPTQGMDMDTMELSTETSKPFDQRFIEAMIPHHNGAIAMDKEAQQKAEHPEIKQLADTIITAQEAEVAHMQQWQRAWFM
ncbi:MAG TPA: DUF305 domain-containing protein [Roseiflexaceae bacterium]|nr:DUF305 domain-containing protein [Roseiflexaceae bacterium]